MDVRTKGFIAGLVSLLSFAVVVNAGVESVEEQVVKYELENGLRLIVLSRPDAPVISSITVVGVGGGDEAEKYFGTAHIFEHMAFKGTENVGTKDFEKEKKAMAVEDSVFALILKERARGAKADSSTLQRLEEEFDVAKQKAREFAISNHYGQILDREGGSDLNAATSLDRTFYMCSVPSNKLELLMCLESDRFLCPVLREFYTEVHGPIAEERRMHTDNPSRKLFEEFFLKAFPPEHPYGHPLIGYMDDILTATRSEAREFFETHYGASNLVVGIVGNVEPAEVKRLAEIYWGRLPKRKDPEARRVPEVAHQGEKRMKLELQSQPMLYVGYHRPNLHASDAVVYDVMADCLGRGRTSRLYRSLVTEQKLAVRVGAVSSMPGEEHSTLFWCLITPARGHVASECETAFYEEIERLREELVSEEELSKVKARVKAEIVQLLESNLWTAFVLAAEELSYGDWRRTFSYLEELSKVTPQDIQRVAKKILVEDNRVVGSIVTLSDSGE
jgi:predicted Zn-dependent peptidase